jgi:hypothetical protein
LSWYRFKVRTAGIAVAVIIRVWLRNDSEYGLGAADAALEPRDCIASVVSAVASLEISLL